MPTIGLLEMEDSDAAIVLVDGVPITDVPSAAKGAAAADTICAWTFSLIGCQLRAAPPMDQCCKASCNKMFHHSCSCDWEMAQFEKENPDGAKALKDGATLFEENPFDSGGLKYCMDHHPHSTKALNCGKSITGNNSIVASTNTIASTEERIGTADDDNNGVDTDISTHPPQSEQVLFHQLHLYDRTQLMASLYYDVEYPKVKPITLTIMGYIVPSFPLVEKDEDVELAIARTKGGMFNKSDIIPNCNKAKSHLQKEVIHRNLTGITPTNK